jgi:microcystin-dependent protein
MAQIEIFSFNFAPKGWTLANGQLLPINQNQALFSLMGTTYGGDGRTTFGLPDLRSRVPISMGGGFVLGQRGGSESVTITNSTMATHNHTLNGDANTGTVNTPATNTVMGVGNGVANPGGNFSIQLYSSTNPNNTLHPATIGLTGGSQPHTNLMPFLTLNYSIALQGIFPSQT